MEEQELELFDGCDVVFAADGNELIVICTAIKYKVIRLERYILRLAMNINGFSGMVKLGN